MTQNTKNLDPVTVVVSNHVKRGKEKEFKEWASGIAKASHTFAGHQGTNIVKNPENSSENSVVYTSIFRFNNHINLAKWEESDERSPWIENLQPLIAKAASYQKVKGLEFWFDIPEVTIAPKPPKYRMALVTLLAIYPLILLVPRIIDQLVPSIVPWYLTTLVSCVCTVILMTWFVMPTMTRIFSFWLFRKQ